MKASKKTFFIVSAIFLVIVILVMIDFAKKSRAPWEKQKTEEVEGE